MIKLKPNKERGETTIKLMWIMFGFSILSILESLFSLKLNFDLVNSNYYSLETYAVINWTSVVFNYCSMGMQIITAIYFIMWFRRAYFNLHKFYKRGLKYSEGWAAGSWFVPIFNLFGPYQITKDLYYKSEKVLVENGKSKINTNIMKTASKWWGFWVTGNLTTNISSRLNFGFVQITIGLIGSLLTVLAAYYCIRTIKEYMGIERKLEKLNENVVTDTFSEDSELIDDIL